MPVSATPVSPLNTGGGTLVSDSNCGDGTNLELPSHRMPTNAVVTYRVFILTVVVTGSSCAIALFSMLLIRTGRSTPPTLRVHIGPYFQL